MPWIALAALVWGVVLGATDGPVAGAAVIGAGLVLLLVRGLVEARRTRRTRAALIASAAARAARPPRATAPVPAPHGTAFRAPDALEAQLLQTFWDFGSVADAAALAGCDEREAQRRLVELVLEPGTPVTPPACPDRVLSDFEERAVVRGWNAGESLAALSAAFGVSVFGVGRVLLAAGPVPVVAPA